MYKKKNVCVWLLILPRVRKSHDPKLILKVSEKFLFSNGSSAAIFPYKNRSLLYYIIKDFSYVRSCDFVVIKSLFI